jgi:hypothetical protein
MSKSYGSLAGGGTAESDDRVAETSGRSQPSQRRFSRPHSPLVPRRTFSAEDASALDENSSLLDHPDSGLWNRSYRSIGPSTPGTPRLPRSYSTNTRLTRNPTRVDNASFSQRLVSALSNQAPRRDTNLGM